jgi:hypothetical protein
LNHRVLTHLALAALLAFSPACLRLASAHGFTATAKKQLQYVVIPHPDDEFSAWALIEKSSTNYPIFIALTRGEHTRYCTAEGKTALQAELGEDEPSPYPYVGRGTESCAQARMNSWRHFLDGMAGIDAFLSSQPAYRGTFAGGFEVWADDKSARVSFDLGDGRLTPEKVTRALQTVRSKRTELFPPLSEYGIVGAAYVNPQNRHCVFNDHPDHQAVAVALSRTDQRTPGPQWVRTCRDDPGVRRIDRVDPDTYAHAMDVGADGYRHGVFQRSYGWLGDVWPQGEDDTTVWSRDQAFWAGF